MTNIDYENLDEMYKNHNSLMKKLWLTKDSEKVGYYDSRTNFFLMENAWEILFPMDKKLWPISIKNLSSNYEENMPWPNFTTYCYSSDVLFPPDININSLLFGYAFMEDGSVVKTAFFEAMILDKNGIPRSVAVDPLAEMKGVKPKYYVGVSVEKEDLKRFRLNKDIRVLEGYVERKNKKEYEEKLHFSYLESYYIQMAYEPHYLPCRLQEFAKENGLPFPEDQRGSV